MLSPIFIANEIDQSAVNQTENTADDKAPPKDYSKGSSGLLKAKS